MSVKTATRRKPLMALSLITAASLALASCTKEESGTLIGAAGGAATGEALGGGVLGVAVGALAGAFVGKEVGKHLDNKDQQAMQQKTQYALENTAAGTTTDWHNPDSGHAGTVTPQRTFTNAQGQPCREYQQTVSVDGKNETAYGTACRQSDGTWKIVSQ